MYMFLSDEVKSDNVLKTMQLLADEKQLNNVIEKILQGKKDGLGTAEVIRSFLEKNGLELGLPPSEGHEAVALLYDLAFADFEEDAPEEGEDNFGNLVKKILENLADQLETSPVFHDTEH